MFIGLVTGLTAEARLARGFGTVIAGGGTRNGALAAARLLVNRGAEALISFGLAGALDPALRAGDLLIPRAVLSGGQRYATDPALVGPATADLLLGGDRILATQPEKLTAWAATGSAAVDLESGAVAEVAAAAKIPFAAFRAICDPAERSLPPAALLALDQLGRIGLIKVAASVIASPGQLPALLGLARDAHAARRTLASNRVRLLFLSNAAKADAARITDAPEQVAADVTRRLPFVTEMAGQPGMWRLRKGQWRAKYRIVNGDVEVVSVAHGKEVYK